MGNIRLKLLAACTAIALTSGAQAATTVSLSGGGDSFAVVGPFNERRITLSGTANFATEIVSGTYSLADLTSFTMNMHVAYHVAVQPPGAFVTADYTFTKADLASFSIEFLNNVPVMGSWSLTPKSPYQSAPSGFQPILGFDLDSNVGPDDPSLTFYQMVDGQKVRIMTGDFNDVTTSVPEPSSWMLMVGGFGMAGAAMRRRRKTEVSFA